MYPDALIVNCFGVMKSRRVGQGTEFVTPKGLRVVSRSCEFSARGGTLVIHEFVLVHLIQGSSEDRAQQFRVYVFRSWAGIYEHPLTIVKNAC